MSERSLLLSKRCIIRRPVKQVRLLMYNIISLGVARCPHFSSKLALYGSAKHGTFCKMIYEIFNAIYFASWQTPRSFLLVYFLRISLSISLRSVRALVFVTIERVRGLQPRCS
jgi:hypothetical protein